MMAWIFDLDGTLTAPMHDFGSFKEGLGLPADLDILAGIAKRPPAEQIRLHAAVKAWEVEHVERSMPAEGAVDLLAKLAEEGRPLGIVTRNTKSTAIRTLDVIGLRDHFPDHRVYGRECALAKPAPDAVLALLKEMGVRASDSVMIGDHIHDVEAGRAAGTQTVWIDTVGDARFDGQADRTILSLRELI